MKGYASKSWFVAGTAALAVALVLAGCSRKPGDIVSPEVADRGLAPLIGHASSGRALPGSYLVVFKNATPARVDGLVDELAGRHGFLSRFRYRNAVRGFAASLSPVALRALRGDPRVAYVEEDQEVRLDVVQSNATWGLDRIDQAGLPLSTTYTFTQTGSGVDAYVIDTGIRFTHSEFGGRAVAGIDEVAPGGTAADQHGHGTHVAGTIGGATFGVAKNVRLISVRVLDALGGGTIAGVTAGVDWVTGNHTTRPAVANMSLGGGLSATLDAAVRNSIADGVVYCVAAGNAASNASIVSPADVGEAITVAASDITDHFASFSNFGSVVDLIAPGVNITSAWLTSDAATNVLSGTSMATPHVTGAAALFLEANPTANPAQVSAAIAGAATAGAIVGVPAGTANRLLFTTLGGPPPPPPPPPAAPVLSTPADGAVGVAVNPLIAWIGSAGATSFRLQVSTDPAFATLFIDRGGLIGSSTGVTGLSGNTQYFWRMSASNAGGSSAFTAPFDFTTGSAPPPPPPPAPPVLTTPANGATGVLLNPLIAWIASAGATSYRLQVSTDPTFATLFIDRSGLVGSSTGITGLSAGTQYFWRMSASNAGGSGAFSASSRFTTGGGSPPPGGAPSVPALLSPSDGADHVSRTPTLSWSAASGATTYRVQVSSNSSFSAIVFDNGSITSTSVTLPLLGSRTRYWWHVRAQNSAGASGYSGTRSFRTVSN